MTKSHPLFLPVKRLVSSTLLALLYCRSMAAQEAAISQVRMAGPKYGILMVVGYEMDKARADAILQTQDMTKDARPLVQKLQQLTQAKGAVHSSCAAQVLQSGMIPN